MENDNTFATIQAEYVKKLAEYEEQKVKLAAKIERLKRKQVLNKYPDWTDHFIRPIIEELVHRMPEIEWEKRSEYRKFGLRAECPIFGKTSDGRTVDLYLRLLNRYALLRYRRKTKRLLYRHNRRNQRL